MVGTPSHHFLVIYFFQKCFFFVCVNVHSILYMCRYVIASVLGNNYTPHCQSRPTCTWL